MRLLNVATLVLLLASIAFAQAAPQNSAGKLPLPKLNHVDPSTVDPTLNPCDDFYKYACSKWMAANPIPADQASWGTESNLQLWNQTVLRNTMVEAAAPDAKRTPVQQKIGDYWSACMDEKGIEARGLSAIRPDLLSIDAMSNKSDLPTAIAHLHMSVPGSWQMDDNQTNSPLFGFGPLQDFSDATLMVAAIDQGGMGMPGRDFYLADNAKLQETRKKYQQHVTNMFRLAGEDAPRATADAAVVLDIETALAKGAMDAVARRDPKNINNPMKAAAVQALTPSFNWAQYYKAVAAPAPRHYIVSSPAFFRALNTLIDQHSLDQWKTYLRWWTLHEHAPYLSKAFVDENFNFYGRELTGALNMRPRWRRCVAAADRDLGDALGQAYVAKAFPPESKKSIDALVNGVESALGRDIQQIDWMQAQTKTKAAEKLHGIYDKVGYPKQWRDYAGVTIARDSYPRNVHAATGFELRRQLNKIGKPVDREEWTMTPPTINAYYDPQMNTINFPAGILQPPFFDAKQDEAENYGAIGMVIGHEITHGFDDQGRKFDAKGNLRDWWTAEDAKKYDERGRCISDEYTADLPALGVKQNGLLTQGEDTADNGGLRIALMALEAQLKKEGKSLDEKGADGFTARQRFFLAHAYSWCQNIRPEIARTIVVTNPHSMPELRVNNVESNMPEFWRAFGCKKGQRMVRENACRVW